MDPLSIAAASTGLAITGIKVSAGLYQWIEDARKIDTTLGALVEEIKSLSRVLDAVSKSWAQNPGTARSQMDPQGDLWYSVRLTLDECTVTMNDLDKQVEAISNSGFRFLRRPTKHMRLNMKSGEILVLKQRIQSYNGTMQIAMQVLSL
jgi:hypothetical protein